MRNPLALVLLVVSPCSGAVVEPMRPGALYAPSVRAVLPAEAPLALRPGPTAPAALGPFPLAAASAVVGPLSPAALPAAPAPVALPAPSAAPRPGASLAPVFYTDATGVRVDLSERVRGIVASLGPIDRVDARQLDDAISVSFAAHAGDERRFSPGMPYLRHIVGTVGTLVGEFGVRDPKAVATMFLHDVREDHPDAWRAHEHRFDDTVRAGVDRLTKTGGFGPYAARLAREGTRDNILQKLSDRINNLRGIRFALGEDDPAVSRAEVLAFARKKYAETDEHLLPLVAASTVLTDRDRRIFYRAVLADVERILRSSPDAAFLAPLAAKLSAL